MTKNKAKKVEKVNLLGVFLKIFIMICIVLSAVIIAGVVYAYCFIPVKTINLCLSDQANDLPIDIECSTDNDCIEGLMDEIESESTKEQMGGAGQGEIAEISFDVIEGLVKTISKESVKCIDNKCKIMGSDNFEQLLSSDESKECSADEEKKEIKITMNDIFPPGKLFRITKKIITSKEIRTTIAEFIKTGNLPENIE